MMSFVLFSSLMLSLAAHSHSLYLDGAHKTHTAPGLRQGERYHPHSKVASCTDGTIWYSNTIHDNFVLNVSGPSFPDWWDTETGKVYEDDVWPDIIDKIAYDDETHFLNASNTNVTSDKHWWWQMRATFCHPKGTAFKKTSAVQVLVNDWGWDRMYWDYTERYSWIDEAAKHGYATIMYNRIGTLPFYMFPDPLGESQSPAHRDTLHYIVQQLRDGKIGTGRVKYDKVIGVGHGYGSILTQAVSQRWPDAFDGVVLTGFTNNRTNLLRSLSLLELCPAVDCNWGRYMKGPIGNFEPYNIAGNELLQVWEDGWDVGMSAKMWDDRNTYSIGELMTVHSVTKAAHGYRKPVMVVNGQHDVPWCHGHCISNQTGEDKGQTVRQLYPDVADHQFESYVAPNTGHALAIHRSLPATLKEIYSFLAKHHLR